MRTEKKEGDFVIRVMDRTGDSKHYWDSENLDEVKAARTMFNDLTGKKFKAYKMTGMGGKGRLLDSFDPKAGKMIFVPAIMGG